jgi:hypothetical protein
MSRMTSLERADWFDSQIAAAASAADADDRLAATLADPALNRWEQTKVAAQLGPGGPGSPGSGDDISPG